MRDAEAAGTAPVLAARVALVALLLVLASAGAFLFLPFDAETQRSMMPRMAPLGLALLATGLWTWRLSRRFPARRPRRALAVAGAAAAAIPVAAVLHNLVTAALSALTGRMVEEPVFFLLATLVLPVLALGAALLALVWLRRPA